MTDLAAIIVRLHAEISNSDMSGISKVSLTLGLADAKRLLNILERVENENATNLMRERSE